MIEKSISAKEKIYFVKDKKQRHNIFGLWSTSLEDILEKDLNKRRAIRIPYNMALY